MLSQWARMGVLAWILGGFCLPLSANTTAAATGDDIRRFHRQGPPLQLAQTDLSIPRDPPLIPPAKPLQIALFLPVSSEMFRQAADAVHAGVQAAHEREPDGVNIHLVDSGDAMQDIAERYRIAAGQADLVIGPLSRSAVAAVAQAGNISKPTIALTAPDIQLDTSLPLPSRMLVMGLAMEDEARQIADWAARDNAGKKAVVLHAGTQWQRRAAKAFELQWMKQRRELHMVELAAADGVLNGRTLLQLKKDLADVPAIIFAALDTQQARQVRAVIGPRMPLYGTSQLNPVPLASRDTAERAADMDGIRLLDIPWQLDPAHPAVTLYIRPATAADRPRTSDMERLYALGIDAYRVAREVAAQQEAMQQDEFELDGVTGRLRVQINAQHARFQRTAERAVYRNGSVAPLEAQP